MSTAHEPGRFEIRLQGHLDKRWSAWFDGMTITTEAGGVTLLHGPVADQAALHGLLARLRDLGIPLISVLPDPRTDDPSHHDPSHHTERHQP